MIMNNGSQNLQTPKNIDNMLKNGLDVIPEEQEIIISKSMEYDGPNYFVSLTWIQSDSQ